MITMSHITDALLRRRIRTLRRNLVRRTANVHRCRRTFTLRHLLRLWWKQLGYDFRPHLLVRFVSEFGERQTRTTHTCRPAELHSQVYALQVDRVQLPPILPEATVLHFLRVLLSGDNCGQTFRDQREEYSVGLQRSGHTFIRVGQTEYPRETEPYQRPSDAW